MQVNLADVPPPDETGTVTVRPETLGICGTDVKIFTGLVPAQYPIVIGHEMVGEVMAAPEGSIFAPGARVLVDPAVSCGRCDLCQRHRPNLCRFGGLMGRDSPGVFADLVAVPEDRLVEVPASVPETASGLLQVLGTCVHAQRTIEVFPGQVAAVVGLGVSGQLMAQLLARRGAVVAGFTRSPAKRELAERLGATVTAHPDEAPVVLDELTEGRGPEIVVEAAGYESTLALAIELAGIGGEVLVFGTIAGGEKGLPYYQMYFKELTLHNPRAALIDDYATAVRLAAAGLINLEPIVTDTLALEDVAAAFALVDDPDSLKVLLRPR
ncbi:MAG TPA: alcohol dehydrogenase catalytic domain-containing protein [Acidimicrobiia bacterium]|jgi:L-iditol 2-dehydrogenase|nr:alcohol dehydrogenase catalytic domain-containing protein [Acidimicrobiia bacterium]